MSLLIFEMVDTGLIPIRRHSSMSAAGLRPNVSDELRIVGCVSVVFISGKGRADDT